MILKLSQKTVKIIKFTKDYKMKILHLSGTFQNDGASSSVINLHKKLIDNKINSECYVHYSKSSNKEDAILLKKFLKKINSEIQDAN